MVLAVWVGVALGGPAGAQPPPRLTVQETGLMLGSPPPILSQASVREHLGTGLTTTFVFRVTGRDTRGGKVEGAAQVEIRYELWDEIYKLTAFGADGRLERSDLASFEELEAHWRGLELTLNPAAMGAPRLRVTLDVIPFSRGEQRDTQRWFSESMDRAGGNAEQAGQVSDERPEALGEVLHLLMATSIQRRSVQTYSWQVPLARQTEQPARGGGPP